MKKLLSLVILLLVAVIMVLTRPDMDAHKAAMMDAVEEYVQEEAQSKIGIKLFARMSQEVVVRTVKLVLDTQLKEHNYYVVNTTSMTLGDKEQLMSVGVLGHVFTFDKDMLRDRMESFLQSRAGDGQDED